MDDTGNFIWAIRKVCNGHRVARKVWPEWSYLYKLHDTVRIAEAGQTSVFYTIDTRAIHDILSDDWELRY